MGLSCLSFANSSGNLLLSDSAKFSIDKKVYFKSEVRKVESSLKYLRCVYPHSFLLKSANFNEKQILNTVLIMEFVDKQVSINYEDYWKTIKSTNCLKNGPSGWSSNLKKLFLSEVYLRDRMKYDSEELVQFGRAVSLKYKTKTYED